MTCCPERARGNMRAHGGSMQLRKRLGVAALAVALAFTPGLAGDRPKGSREVEAAIGAGVGWLERHQHEDGHWGASTFDERCKDGKCDGSGIAEFDVGITALATLALIKSGHAP